MITIVGYDDRLSGENQSCLTDLIYFDSVKVTDLSANTAAYADVRIDVMRLASFTSDGIHGAVTSANGAASAKFA